MGLFYEIHPKSDLYGEGQFPNISFPKNGPIYLYIKMWNALLKLAFRGSFDEMYPKSGLENLKCPPKSRFQNLKYPTKVAFTIWNTH